MDDIRTMFARVIGRIKADAESPPANLNLALDNDTGMALANEALASGYRLRIERCHIIIDPDTRQVIVRPDAVPVYGGPK